MANNTNIQNAGTVTTIDLFDVIGDDWAGTTPTAIAPMIEAATGDIVVRIASPGGDVQDGFAIANLLKQSPNNVTVNIIGWAASIASIIALAGDKVVMAEGGFFMIHKPSAGIIGESDDLRGTADLLDKIEDGLVDVYVSEIAKRGRLINGDMEATRAQVAEWVTNETWFTAQEALAAGFIDEVEGMAIATQQTDNININNFSNQFFNRAPERVPQSTKMANDKKGFFARLFNWLATDEDAKEEFKTLVNEGATQEQMEAIEAPTQEEIDAAKAILQRAQATNTQEEEVVAVEEVAEEVVEEIQEEEAIEAPLDIEARIRAKLEAEYKTKLAEAKAGAPSGSNTSTPTTPSAKKPKTIQNAAAALVSKNKSAWETLAKNLSNRG